MKFLSLIVLTQIVSSLAQNRLTPKENLERLENCGKENPIQPTDTTWLWLAEYTDPFDASKQFLSTASMISNRHFLLSAYVLIDENMKWRVNGSNFDGHCINQNKNARIPDDFVKQLVFRPPECYKISNTKCDTINVTPTRGYVLKACDGSIWSPYIFKQRYTQMIVEFETLDKTNHTYNYPCLMNPRDHHAVDGYAMKYAFNSENEPEVVRGESCVIQGFGSSFPCGSHSDKEMQGSVAMKQLNGTKWTIVGMGSTGIFARRLESAHLKIHRMFRKLPRLQNPQLLNLVHHLRLLNPHQLVFGLLKLQLPVQPYLPRLLNIRRLRQKILQKNPMHRKQRIYFSTCIDKWNLGKNLII
ncbi:unnamed protein product [Caenorhabditis nigoni]